MTLIVIKDGDKVVRRCDARCYDAKTENCTCACKGMNHGKGLDEAQANVANHFQHMKEEFEKENPDRKLEIKVND